MIALSRAEVFGRTFDCSCGKTHCIQPAEIVYAGDAVERLPLVVARATEGRRACVLMDTRTRAVAGAAVAKVVQASGMAVQEVLVADPAPGKSPVCDDVTKAALESEIAPFDVMIPVGAGVVNDLGKWIAGDRGLPFVAFATAASMNGHSSANVAPAIDGVKTLVRARPPYAVLSSPAVLRAAPYELTAAGLGDILAKSVSSADWRLNQLLFGDYYCARSVDLVADLEPLYMDRPEAVRAREPEAIEALFRGLLLTGAAMTMAESSAPASGGEHMLSHTLDMLSAIDGAPHDLHGRQVGVGTILAAELYRRVLAVESPRLREPPSGIDTPYWGRLAGIVAGYYAEKAGRLRQAREWLSQPGAWDRLRAALAPMLRPPEAIRDCLRRAGAAYRAEDIGCARARMLAAFAHAHQIRSRFTILDLANLLGLMPAAAGEIVEQFA